MSEETKVEEVAPKPEDAPPPAPNPTPEPKNDGLNEKVDRLQEEISGLRTLVENIVNTGDPDMDKGPVNKPWTHWSPRSK